MAIAHIAVLTAALVLPVTVPYAVAAVRRRDEFRRRRACPGSSRLDRALRDVDPGVLTSRLGPVPIEWLAGELRRLDRQRRGGVTLESEVWQEAVVRAYDERLCMACQCLGVSENLRPLDGLDREFERMRVEDALQAAGLELR
ncbi:hypothetical protein KOI35_29300 [Actinoplanes bogorensis]|uniref:Uncharacterized protein n=1 Tax=Paractinoplanes bogorensis TaxID=1610840 RepID=A0ABS5YVZ7_9ACTN|nr:hypothetical protein [Actinoplanes bogorensis]MBU2667618.1 hypothetical protein [Actinoplanes bogorensis]